MTDQPLTPVEPSGTVEPSEPASDGPVEPIPTELPGAAEPGPGAVPPAPEAKRRVLRAALRWTSAVLVFAALGGATAYAVTEPRRTDIPGLRTPDDGRWKYPALSLPRLPQGAARPLDTDLNPGGDHYADLRALLLPLPEGAKADPAFPGLRGWLPTGTFLRLFRKDEQQALGQQLKQEGLRHIAARAWTTRDGTRAEIYLLQYSSRPYASRAEDHVMSNELVGAPSASTDPEFFAALGVPDGVSQYVYDEDKPVGRDHVRYAYLIAGDTVAVIVLSRRGSLPAVPFHQTVILQSQLLG